MAYFVYLYFCCRYPPSFPSTLTQATVEENEKEIVVVASQPNSPDINRTAPSGQQSPMMTSSVKLQFIRLVEPEIVQNQQAYDSCSTSRSYLVRKRNKICTLRLIETAQVLKLRDEVQRLSEELKILKLLKLGKQVIRALDFIQTAETLGILFENEGMRPLDEVNLELKQLAKPFNGEQLTAIVQQVTQAVHYLHAKQVAHRDLKLSNVWISQQGRIKLGNFTSAKLLQKSALTTFVGTPDYMAPEMIKCSRGSGEYTEMVDWWACGVLAYELCNYVTPFYSTDVDDLYENIVQVKFSTKRRNSFTKADAVKQFCELVLVKSVETRRRNVINKIDSVLMKNPITTTDFNLEVFSSCAKFLQMQPQMSLMDGLTSRDKQLIGQFVIS